MHAAMREQLILAAFEPSGFVSYRELEMFLPVSPATIRRDLTRLEECGRIVRIHGGARQADGASTEATLKLQLAGTPFVESITRNLAAKQAIGRAAAAMCEPGEGVMIDGGTTTLQMCPHLAGLDLQVLTNSLHIVNALLPRLFGKDLRTGDHPVAWSHCVGRGRVFYSALGHRAEAYAEPQHRRLLLNAVQWAVGGRECEPTSSLELQKATN